MLQEQLIEEIKQIPNEKLAEIYDLIHYFRLGLAQENQQKIYASALLDGQKVKLAQRNSPIC